MIFTDRSASLCHYGVLGMKWGVRKDGKPQGFQYGGLREEEFVEPLSRTLRPYGGLGTETEYDRGMMRKYHETSAESDMYMANAQYNLFDEENKGNCMLDSMAYDMRRKGYAVHAGANDGNGTSCEELQMYYDDPLDKFPAGGGDKESFISSMLENSGLSVSDDYNSNLTELSNLFDTDIDSASNALYQTQVDYCNKINDDLSYLPPNARGELIVGWLPPIGGSADFASVNGHAINWETDKNRVLSYRDCQTRETYTPEEFTDHFSVNINPACPGQCFRLDNATPNIERMLEDGVICNDDDYEIHVQPNYVITPTGDILPPIPEDA